MPLTPEELLGPELAAPTVWPADDSPIPDSQMAAAFKRAENIHKTAHFIPVYDKVFAPYRRRPPVRMLEIGVACGGSLHMWRDYFPDSCTVVGIDGNPQCARFDQPDRNMFVRVGQQQDTDFLKAVVDEFGPFDIILDDGSHIPSYTLSTFKYLFPHGLKDDGTYLVEDLEWCYMPCGREPFKNEPNDGTPTFTEVIKHLVDVMHTHYEGRATENFQADEPARLPEVTVPLATTLIESVQVWDGIAAITKQPRPLPRLLFNVDPDFLREWLKCK